MPLKTLVPNIRKWKLFIRVEPIIVSSLLLPIK